jgi:glycosyltransferase involved in cell wall biosynthesis
MQSMIRSGISPDRLRVTYNSAWDFEITKSAELWRNEWNVAPEEVVVGTVAHVRPIKGIDILVRAMLEMTDVPNWKLVIVGKIDDGLVTALSEFPAIQRRVLFTGHLEHAPCAMQAFDLFVMPSRSEGLCRALIEAMMQGVCPIVSSAGGMKELVRHGQDGLVFPIDDFISLSLGLRQLVRDQAQRQRFGRSACERVKTMCNPKVVVDRLENLYSYVMQRDWDDEFD